MRTAASLVVLYLTMFVNNSSSVKSTVGSKPRSMCSRANTSEVKSKMLWIESKVRLNVRCAAPPRGSLHEHHRDVVLLRRAVRERLDRFEQPRRELGHRRRVVRANDLLDSLLAELLVCRVAVFVYAVGEENQDVAGLHVDGHRGAQR